MSAAAASRIRCCGLRYSSTIFVARSSASPAGTKQIIESSKYALIVAVRER